MKPLKSFSLLLLLSALTACNMLDKGPPELTINTPMEGDTLQSGQVLVMNWTASDDNELHHSTVVLTNQTEGTQVFSAAPYVHNIEQFATSHTVTPQVTVLSRFRFSVTVSDHYNHETEQIVEFFVQP